MAESASTGNSGTTSTGAGSQSTSTTSTSNSGPAASGSQASSNGSFSTGNGNNGNNGNGNNGVGPGLSFGAGVGALGGPSGLPGLTPGFTGFAASNFGQGWGNGSDGSSTNNNNTKPVMTVDEVYGKGSQSIVENQGDYEASSNEKSNVETSTFGKQDEISVTPLSITEDKGLVNNDAIQSIEGLDFQQKDKANQEVMEAKKSRDEAEAEDNANGMRNQLKAVAEKEEAAEEENNFQIGDRDEDVAKAKSNVDQLAQQESDMRSELAFIENDLNLIEAKTESMQKESQRKEVQVQNNKSLALIGKNVRAIENLLNTSDSLGVVNKTKIGSAQMSLDNLAAGIGIDSVDLPNDIENARQTFQAWENNLMQEYFGGLKDFSDRSITVYQATTESQYLSILDGMQKYAEESAKDAKRLEARKVQLQQSLENNKSKRLAAEEAYNNLISERYAEVETPTPEAQKSYDEAMEAANAKKAEETVTAEAPAYEGIIDAAKEEIANSKDLTDEQKSETITVLDNVKSAAGAMNKAANDYAANPNAVNAQKYVEETARYNKALKDAKGNNTLKNTNFNKTFTEAVAGANDFMVTREDGTQQNYAEFAAEMAVKSPELAAKLYEAKAQKYEADKHPVLAKIERAKSKMVMTWLGSKFTFADNQVRNQFIQMAKTDIRATYATYDNVLSDETGKYSEADKAEASKAINQAKSLMTASAALQASTGFLSGIGDSMSNGVYGVTKPGSLNAYQEALNTASNFAKIALGLGVTPGANEAYQNMYYMAGDKVNESVLFNKDFDGDGFALCQEYGNNAAVGMIAGAGELAAGIALMFNPATSKMGINLAIDAVQTFLDGLYGVQKEVNKSIKYSSEVLNYFSEAKSIAAETGNKEAIGTMDSAIKQIEDFQLKSDEVGNLDNWLEGSGSNTADNGKFNQALSYDEWLKLIEADPVMQEYAKSLNR